MSGMARKRLTRAEIQARVEEEFEERNDRSILSDNQAHLEAALGQIPRQHEQTELDNEHNLDGFYKSLETYLWDQAQKEAQLKQASLRRSDRVEHACIRLTEELERLRLEKKDPELSEDQWRDIADIKQRLIEDPKMMTMLYSDAQLLADVKEGYESQLTAVQEQLEMLRGDCFSARYESVQEIEKLLTGYFTHKIHRAIAIVKNQHEVLEDELCMEREKSAKLEERVDNLTEEVTELKAENAKLHAYQETGQSSLKESLDAALGKISALENDLSTEKQARRSLKESAEVDIQKLRTEVSSANEANVSLANSTSILEIKYKEATERVFSRSRIILWQLSTLHSINTDMQEPGEEMISEMAGLVNASIIDTKSLRSGARIPDCMTGLTIVGKTLTRFSEPNQVTACHLWITARCGSLSLDGAQAFYHQSQMTAEQVALLPWIHSSLDHAITTMSGQPNLMPNAFKPVLQILQGLVYAGTVASLWPKDQIWQPDIQALLANSTSWLSKHIPNDETSLLTMITERVRQILIIDQMPSMPISPSMFPGSRRIDSSNSDLQDTMAIVIDISGSIIVFSKDSDAFIFGAQDMRIMEEDLLGRITLVIDQAVSGLPASLQNEIRVLQRGPPDLYDRICRLLKGVLTEEHIATVSSLKRYRAS